MMKALPLLFGLALVPGFLGCDASPSSQDGEGQAISTGDASSPDTAADGSSDGPQTTCVGIPVHWRTSTVSLAADEFWIVADGQCFTSAGADVSVHSDPGSANYTSLELEWTENDTDMRLFIYLWADATGWRSNEMRTYDGQPPWNPDAPGPFADWLYYRGTFFRSPIGTAFSGSVDLINAPVDPFRGELHLHGLQLSTTLPGT